MNEINFLLKKHLYKIQCIEKHIVENLPVFIEKAESDSFKNELKEYYNKTSEKHLEILTKFRDELHIDDSISNCNSINSLVTEVKSYITLPQQKVNDAGLIANFQRLLSSKTSLYTSALRFSRELNLKSITNKIQGLLNETYDINDAFDKIEEDRLTQNDIKSL